MSKTTGHLGDAALSAILIVALLSGAPVWIVVGAYLALDMASNLFKALNALLEPIVEALKTATGRA